MTACHQCQTPWESPSTKTPGVKEICDHCGAYLHACLNCKHYDTSKPCQCYIPNIELVTDKQASNFCDEFQFITDAERSGAPQPRDSAKDDLNKLFGDDDDPAPPSDFDDLFG
jgi:hypothetical protein